MTDLQRDIFKQKYEYNGEGFSGFLDRVSGGNSLIRKLMKDKKILPAGRILAGRGLHKEGKKITLSNCYVLPQIQDNIESIFDTAKEMARTYSWGGGVGIDISKLRPKNSQVNNAANTTSGAISFMDLYSMTTELIGQKGRRGALMITLDCKHPDVIDFINCKTDLNKVTKANISLKFTDDFMRAVGNKEDWGLEFIVESTGEKIIKTVNAYDMYKLFCTNDWNYAEPSAVFWDRIEGWHLLSEDEELIIVGLNPCAEEPLIAYGSCNLIAENLSEMVKNKFTRDSYFDFEELDKITRNAVVYMNEILDESIENHLYPLEKQRQAVIDWRQIGIGVMGIADMLIKLGIRYGSVESINLCNKIGKQMINSALQQSALLAKEYGAYPKYKKEKVFKSPFFIENATQETKNLVAKYGLRNSQLLTIAPTGSISTMLGVSGGIEPIFMNSYTRMTQTLHEEDTYYKVYTPIVQEYMEYYNIKDEKDLPNFFITAMELDYKERIDMQAVWQRYIDASISSTVNLPNSATVEDVEELYIYAWEKGLKGITIYRDGCARSGILTSDKPTTKKKKIEEIQEDLDKAVQKELEENPNKCPMCGGEMFYSGGCKECRDCAYSPCSI